MEIELIKRPGNAAAHVRLNPDESCSAEGGAMIAMSDNIHVETTTHQKSGGGGIIKGLKRMLSGESFFINHFKADSSGGEIWLAATLPGDMMVYELNEETLIVQGGSYVAAEPGVSIDLGWQGFKSFFSGESVFWLRVSGQGKVILSSFGAIYPVEVDGEHIVDTGHIVAFNETLNFSITKAGKSWLSSILGGEGLVTKFKGRGTVWCQSHNAISFGRTLGPMLRPRK
jgi:uncharacterized protein (TIGR00266 family)